MGCISTSKMLKCTQLHASATEQYRWDDSEYYNRNTYFKAKEGKNITEIAEEISWERCNLNKALKGEKCDTLIICVILQLLTFKTCIFI
jgi:hypothetical protein